MGGRHTSAGDGGRRGQRRGRDRAQTVQDFAVGASVFLLTIAFVFAFVPSLFTPFNEDVDPGAASAADRVSAAILDEYSKGEQSNWMDDGDFDDLFDNNPTTDDLQDKFGLQQTFQINITLVPLDGTSPVSSDWTAGQEYFDRPAASVSRVVVVEGVTECDPDTGSDGKGCRLIIRIW